MSDADRAIIDALWTKVTEDFAASKPHQAFLEHCRQSDQLPEAARRYRQHKEQLDDDDEVGRAEADKRLSAIALLAMAQLDANRSTPQKSKLTQVLTLIMATITLAAMVALVKALLL